MLDPSLWRKSTDKLTLLGTLLKDARSLSGATLARRCPPELGLSARSGSLQAGGPGGDAPRITSRFSCVELKRYTQERAPKKRANELDVVAQK
ncbi:hypothetical protein EYF80_047415 [Liparis tanakae]|uniref:Uncharacterized protein n=1 Tax=Liparis tanakae TaxID=230148 RepID=A0A4Z2FQ01_9TELE|nr:hypothetical protein EYF80_047415 [Liparis tanakae]